MATAAPMLMPVMPARNWRRRSGWEYKVSKRPPPLDLDSFWGWPVLRASVRELQKG